MKKLLLAFILSILHFISISQIDKGSVSDIALEKIKADNNKEALNDLNKGIKDCNDCIGLYILRSIANSNLGNYKGALKDLKQATKINPNYAEAYYNKGVIYHDDLKKNKRAVKEYTRAIQINPENHFYYTNRGIAYSELKKYKEALADLEKAISLIPDTTLGYRTREIDIESLFLVKAEIYIDLYLYEDALEECNRALNRDTTYNHAYGLKGIIYYKTGDLDKACQNFKRSAEHGNSSVNLQNIIKKTCE